MLVFRRVPERAAGPTVLTIGNFDGVHRGHHALLARLAIEAQRLRLPASLLTFEPHPREFFSPDQAPARLTSLREKLKLIEQCGIDRVYVCRFNAAFAAYSAEEFVKRILVDGLATRHLIIGDDFRFGRGRAGDFAMLLEAGRSHGFSAEALPTIEWQGERVSSSAVRDSLEAGAMEHAARLLGRPYNIAGRVVGGDRLGRLLGFPTANVQLKRKQVPLFGVFAVTVTGVAALPWPGAASLGVRATVAEGLQPALEVFLLDYQGSLYGAHVSVEFLHKLRDQAKFESLDALKAQIALDVMATRTYFANKNNG